MEANCEVMLSEFLSYRKITKELKSFIASDSRTCKLPCINWLIFFPSEIHHPNVIELRDVFGHKSNISLVMDFMDTDLVKIIFLNCLYSKIFFKSTVNDKNNFKNFILQQFVHVCPTRFSLIFNYIPFYFVSRKSSLRTRPSFWRVPTSSPTSFRPCSASSIFTNIGFYTETSNQTICSSIEKAFSKLEISVWRSFTGRPIESTHTSWWILKFI